MSVILLNDASLKDALRATSSKACTCAVGLCAAWESVPEERITKTQMTHIGTLRHPDIAEPTFDEHHVRVDGKLTHYDSPDAPISSRHFPYNRCDAHQCSACNRVLLKYTEYGGYFVDQRVRWARPELMPAQ
jgi:hypothetical protein